MPWRMLAMPRSRERLNRYPCFLVRAAAVGKPEKGKQGSLKHGGEGDENGLVCCSFASENRFHQEWRGSEHGSRRIKTLSSIQLCMNKEAPLWYRQAHKLSLYPRSHPCSISSAVVQYTVLDHFRLMLMSFTYTCSRSQSMAIMYTKRRSQACQVYSTKHSASLPVAFSSVKEGSLKKQHLSHLRIVRGIMNDVRHLRVCASNKLCTTKEIGPQNTVLGC